MDALMQDLKAAGRSLRARKGFVVVAVATLALALGANSSVFAVIDAVLLEQLPYPEAERLAILGTSGPDGDREVLSVLNFEDYQAGGRAVERMAAWFDQGSTSRSHASRSGSRRPGVVGLLLAGSDRVRPWGGPSRPRSTAEVVLTWRCSAMPSGGDASARIPASSAGRCGSATTVTR